MNGMFLVSAANSASSRALVGAAWPYLAGVRLRVLIGGLGIGDALGEALACERVSFVAVAELEPVIVRWFHEHAGETARRATAAERDGRLRLVAADVAGLLEESPAAWDLVALDTDNGPEWLAARRERSPLLARRAPQRARRPACGGVAVFWSPGRLTEFE